MSAIKAIPVCQMGLIKAIGCGMPGIGKKFLKNKAAELKLSVFDLLKQNQSISRTVEANYIEDTQSQVLQQYFMLTFTYSLKNFGIRQSYQAHMGKKEVAVLRDFFRNIAVNNSTALNERMDTYRTIKARR